jgi:hypothetical protein
MEGRYQAIDHLETGLDLLALALAEGSGDPSSKDFGAHIIRIAVDTPGTLISTALTVGWSICRNATSPPPTRPSLANTDADCRKSRYISEWQ